LALLQKLNQTSGITMVLVTHEADIAACTSRVVTMRDGRIRSDVKTSLRDAAQMLERMEEGASLPDLA
jgi:putative ABC transport system ATP-binding protein